MQRTQEIINFDATLLDDNFLIQNDNDHLIPIT